MHVVLAEPDYYTKYPPLGLLKLASYYKKRGDTVEFIRGFSFALKKPDRVYVTSLFTWAWKRVHDCVQYYKALYPDAEVWLGGLYASLMPEHAELSGADRVWIGLFDEAEDLLPDYSLIPGWRESIVFASRGCPRNCPFCAVPRLEGSVNSERRSIKDMIYPEHKKVVFVG